MAAKSISLLAPAKINLALRVVGRAANGLHELNAPTIPLDLADEVTVTLRKDRYCENTWHHLKIAEEAELGLYAAKLLQLNAPTAGGVSIKITKHVPIGAGLGGGSSDAAAVLLACNRLWKLNWPLAKLADLGAEIGSDVPFFVFCKQSQIQGTGDKLAFLEPPMQGIVVVVVPKIRCATKEVFATFAHGNLPDVAESDPILGPAVQLNDLLPAALSLQPGLEAILHQLHQAAGGAALSGSGSACFAPVPSVDDGIAVAQALAKLEVQTYVCRMMKSRIRKLGSSQAVRQRILAPLCAGSNPASPAN